MARIFVSSQVQKLTKMNAQHLHSLHEGGLELSISTPVGRGTSRLYSEGDALSLLVYATLRKEGVESAVAKSASIKVQKKLGDKMVAGSRLVLSYARSKVQLSTSVKGAFWKLPLRPLIERVKAFNG